MTPLGIFLFVWLAPAVLLLLGAATIVTWDRVRRGRAGGGQPAASANPASQLPNPANDDSRKAA